MRAQQMNIFENVYAKFDLSFPKSNPFSYHHYAPPP